jgi:hypothetical protein
MHSRRHRWEQRSSLSQRVSHREDGAPEQCSPSRACRPRFPATFSYSLRQPDQGSAQSSPPPFSPRRQPQSRLYPPVLSHTRQHLSARTRSSTPIPVYEPPKERFTPPREVIRPSPRVSKSSKRKKTLKITIKKEPPEIDLSRLPPPSPTDDPLLLHGRVRSPRPPVPTNARETPLLESTPPGPGKQLSPFKRCALDFPLPGIPSDVDDSEDAELLKQPIFNFAADGEDSSSLDGSGSEQEGEYTGKFRVVHVPTKADPPTSTTRGRIEQWGRPISPFPRKGSPIPEIVADNGPDDSSDLDLSLAQPQFHQERVEDRHVPEALEDAQEDAQEAGSTIELQGEHAKPIEIAEMEHAVPSKTLLTTITLQLLPISRSHVLSTKRVAMKHTRVSGDHLILPKKTSSGRTLNPEMKAPARTEIHRPKN